MGKDFADDRKLYWCRDYLYSSLSHGDGNGGLYTNLVSSRCRFHSPREHSLPRVHIQTRSIAPPPLSIPSFGFCISGQTSSGKHRKYHLKNIADVVWKISQTFSGKHRKYLLGNIADVLSVHSLRSLLPQQLRASTCNGRERGTSTRHEEAGLADAIDMQLEMVGLCPRN